MPPSSARVELLAPETSGASEDRVPDELADGTPQPLRRELERLVGVDQVLGRISDLVRYASDASPYRLIPKAVVMAKDADDVGAVLAYGRRSGTPVTLRSGGTSLNGQGQGDGILVDVRRHFTGTEVLDGGERARIRPGTVLGHANRVLAPLGRKLGPDPASTDIATVGGVIANNSGGMRCGVVRDSYSTVRELTFVLPSGTAIDSGAPDAAARFAAEEPALAQGLAEIRDEIRADAELTERIRHKFEIKNTTGYRLCAFLDAEEPVEIFRRLLVGSEGTLAFIAEAVFETVPQPPKTTISWLHFPGIEEAAKPVPGLVAAGATAVELMVAPALMVASQNIAGAPADWLELPPESAALLVEFGADTDAELDQLEAKAIAELAGEELIREPDFTRDPERVEVAWTVREGLHGLIGKLRPPGTSLIIEDVCVPPPRIAESARDIQALLGEHGFLTGVAGHTSAGNLHFMLTPDFTKPEDLERYEKFMGGLVELILDKYDGSLKAEHGTGVNMAPYVEREWGAKATELMWRIKRLADPDGVLAPGVLLNRDPGVHLRNLKSTPPIEEIANACVECGFCEPVCPSRNLTTTPRQRIVLRREMARQPAESAIREALIAEHEYDVVETCAADGSCAVACPVGIDTGKLIKELRRRESSPRAERSALAAAKRWGTVERAARAGLRVGGGPARLSKRGKALPKAARRLPSTERDAAAAVYLPACINRIFGNPRGGDRRLSLPEALVAVSERAGLPVWIPDDAAGHCCGTPFHSKGRRQAHEWMAGHTAEALWRWSGEGELPVVIDASSCTNGVVAELPEALADEWKERLAKLEVLDSVAWGERLLERLEVKRRAGSATVHPTCSARHLGLERRLQAIAEALAEEVVVPPSATCCGFAGDRGMLHPELTAAATRDEAAEVTTREFDLHLSSNRTCEMGLERATGRMYESFLFPLEELTR
jgi:D-lactate dehydrogenase